MKKFFKCSCGALTLRTEGNFLVKFPDGRTMRFCHRGCSEGRKANRLADKEWREHRKERKLRQPLRRLPARSIGQAYLAQLERRREAGLP